MNESSRYKNGITPYPLQIPLFIEYEPNGGDFLVPGAYHKTSLPENKKKNPYKGPNCLHKVKEPPNNSRKDYRHLSSSTPNPKTNKHNQKIWSQIKLSGTWFGLIRSKSMRELSNLFQSFTKDNNAKTAGGPVSERSISTLPLAQSTIKSEPPVSTLSPLSSSSQSTGSSQRSTRTTSKALRDHFDTNYKRDKGYTTNIHSIGNKYAFSKSQEQLNALADHITVNEQEDQPWFMTPSGFKFSIYGWPISRVTLIQTLPFCASAVTVPRQQTQS